MINNLEFKSRDGIDLYISPGLFVAESILCYFITKVKQIGFNKLIISSGDTYEVYPKTVYINATYVNATYYYLFYTKLKAHFKSSSFYSQHNSISGKQNIMFYSANSNSVGYYNIFHDIIVLPTIIDIDQKDALDEMFKYIETNSYNSVENVDFKFESRINIIKADSKQMQEIVDKVIIDYNKTFKERLKTIKEEFDLQLKIAMEDKVQIPKFILQNPYKYNLSVFQSHDAKYTVIKVPYLYKVRWVSMGDNKPKVYDISSKTKAHKLYLNILIDCAFKVKSIRFSTIKGNQFYTLHRRETHISSESEYDMEFCTGTLDGKLSLISINSEEDIKKVVSIMKSLTETLYPEHWMGDCIDMHKEYLIVKDIENNPSKYTSNITGRVWSTDLKQPEEKPFIVTDNAEEDEMHDDGDETEEDS